MTIQPNDPWQDAADQASGMEGTRKAQLQNRRAATVDGAEVGPDFRMCLFLEVAFHGWLKFEDNQLVDKDLRRFANEAPDPKEQRDGWEPNTSCLGLSVPSDGSAGRLLTYCGSSWSVRRAFMTQLVPPFQRQQRQAIPIVALGFTAQKDTYGNFRPVFNVVDWRPRRDFAAILGAEPVPALEALGNPTPPRPPLVKEPAPEWSRLSPPPIEENDRAGYERVDEIPF